MSRENVVGGAALFGLVGVVLLSIGGLGASYFLSTFDLWFAALLALAVWCGHVYGAMWCFGQGVYAIVEDAQAGSA